MFLKTLLFVLTINCLSEYSCAQRNKKFFRKDYSFLEDTESFYKFHTLPKTWPEAKKLCALEGASLFYPQNDHEAHIVISYWNATQPHHAILLGISDLIVKGVFETIDGYPISDVYNRWYRGEPNDAGGVEDCVVMMKDGRLNDDGCNKKFPFMCKKTLQSLEWNQQCNIPNLDYVFNLELGRCYKFHSAPKNWTEAYAACSAEQSYLAVINTQAEADLLVRTAEAASQRQARRTELTGVVHLGFHNRLDEGWQAVGGIALEDTGYAVWGSNQPDGGSQERCGAMSSNGLLHDINCNTRASFICEHEVDTLSSQLDDRFGELALTNVVKQ
ncbi:C-type mannose receptor 2 [Helicoverpa armigera]|uniref:C-type mannose receptor 2 n=1 Tax=Helicoverpa armigera TaxID=29058 RepID=UPI0030833F60